MTLLNHIGVILMIYFILIVIYLYLKLADYLSEEPLFNPRFGGFMLIAFTLGFLYECGYWIFKIFF